MSWGTHNNSNSNNNNNKALHHLASEQQQQQQPNTTESNNNNSASRSRSPQQQQHQPPPSHQRSSGAQKSVEGWILIVTGIHDELEEDDLTDLFSDFGVVQQIGVNQDRQTGGNNKGYALVEYGAYTEAQDAINALHGSKRNGNTVRVDWAFVKPTGGGGGHGHGNRARRGNTGSSTGR